LRSGRIGPEKAGIFFVGIDFGIDEVGLNEAPKILLLKLSSLFRTGRDWLDFFFRRVTFFGLPSQKNVFALGRGRLRADYFGDVGCFSAGRCVAGVEMLIVAAGAGDSYLVAVLWGDDAGDAGMAPDGAVLALEFAGLAGGLLARHWGNDDSD
jgi:hypothetical protein